MFDRVFITKEFWSSKLGQAALASIVATTAMVVFSTQIESAPAHAATLAQPDTASSVMIEIA